MTVLYRILLLGAWLGAALLLPSAAFAQAGEIRGVVRHKGSGSPLADIRVSAYTEDGTLIAQAFTSLSGEYVLPVLPSRFYYLSAGKTLLEFLPEAYGCGYGCAVVDSTPVPVSPGQTTSGIDFALEPPADITGTVTSGLNGQPVAFRIVRLTSADGRSVASVATNASGVYSATTLPSGSYYVTTEGTPGLIDERYPNVPCDPTCAPTTGTPVALVAGAVTTAIDFELAGDPPAGTIAGTVRNAATNAPLTSTSVSVFNALGQFVANAPTNAQGSYSIAVSPGTYTVRTNLGPPYQHYQNELFSEIPCNPDCLPANGTAVLVTSGVTASGIDFTVTPGAVITGAVTAAGGGPLGSVPVNVLNPAGALVATTATSGAGAYGVTVPPGTYFVETANGMGSFFADERYDDESCAPTCTATQGTPVVVAAGDTATGIDFALEPTWTLTGTITNAATAAPLAGVYVQIFTQQGQWLRTLFPTNASGAYTDRLPAGAYYVRTGLAPPGYGSEIFNDVPCIGDCDVTTGTPVVITPGATTVADFALAPPGTLSGRVTRADTTAPVSVHVEARASDGTLVATTVTDGNGDYLLVVTPGQYRVYALPLPAATYLVPEVYDNVPCPVVCSVTAGVPVTVLSGQTTDSINFALGPGGTIDGYVTDAETGEGLTGVHVVVHRSDGTPFSYVTTGYWGAYTVPVAPGTYFLRTRVPVATNYIDELPDGTPCAPTCSVTGGTPVVVSAGATTAAVNFALTSGGMLSGQVIEAESSAPVGTIFVELSTSSGEKVGSALTNASGHFTFGGLATGSYRLRTVDAWSRGYADVLYANVPCAGCAVTLGTAVPVTAGLSTGGLTLALSPGGSFTGVVRSDPYGGTLASIPVHVYRADGGFVRTAFSGIDGRLTVEGLPAGTYFARTGAEHYGNEWYGGAPCAGTCAPPQGSPIAVAVGATTSGIDFDLPVGGSLSGRVTDAGTALPIPADEGAIQVVLFSVDGARLGATNVDGAGRYEFTGVAAGSYRVRTVTVLGHIDEQFDDVVCLKSCTPAAGEPIVVATGATTTNINFALSAGGRIAGSVTNAISNAPIADAIIRVYAPDGTWVADGKTDGTGTYTTAEGLASGTYYARTFSAAGYVDQIHSGLGACLPVCLPTDGTPIVVAAGATTTGVDFALTPGTELIQNGGFTYGTAHWMAYATPTMDYMPWRVSNGMFEFGRVPPPTGTVNQAVVFQNTGVPVASGAALIAQFDLGNTSAVRKRISVLLHDADFGDLSVCTFWLPPNLPPTRYAMRTRATRLWSNATIAFYAASTNVPAGDYQVDNVSLQVPTSVVIERTDCIEPAPPATGGGAPGPDLLVNGDFSSGAIAPGWMTYGQITSQVSDGVFEFVRPAGTPAGVLLQTTGQAVPAGTTLTATFQVGNSSGVRKRVTTILHDSDFSDLSACTFWLEPGQPLLPFTYRAFTTKAWTNATLSVYPATVGADEWIRFDDATLRVTPGNAVAGVECIEPDGGSWGSGHDVRPTEDAGGVSRRSVSRAAGAGTTTATTPTTAPALAPGAGIFTLNGWIGDGFEFTSDGWVATPDMSAPHTLTRATAIDLSQATDARLTFESWLSGANTLARVEVSLDGETWFVTHVVESSDTWMPTEVSLSAWQEMTVHVRLVLESAAVEGGSAVAAAWRIRDLRSIESGP